MDNNEIQLRNQVMSGARSLYDVLTELGVKIETESKNRKMGWK